MFEYKDLIGIPFVDGGRNKHGLDCWGLVMVCYGRQGIHLKDYPISAWALSSINETMQHEENEWEKVSEPAVGDLVVISTDSRFWANHVGVYVGNGIFIHAYAYSGVCLSKVSRWKAHIVGYYRYRYCQKSFCYDKNKSV